MFFEAVQGGNLLVAPDQRTRRLVCLLASSEVAPLVQLTNYQKTNARVLLTRVAETL